jgi:type I restriction enzyme S subunit
LICDGVTGVGGSLTRAQPKRVAEFSVPIAPLGEQQSISDKLDALLARVGACRDRLDRIPPILKRFKQAVLRAACSGAMSYKPEIASGSSHETLSQIGPFSIPADWELVPLKELVDNFDAKRVPVRAGDRATRQGAYPYYGAFGVIDHVDDYLFDGDFLLVAEDGKNLATRDRPISLIARGKFWVNNHAHVLKTRGHMRVEYLNHWINSDACDLSPLLTGIDQVKLTRAAMDSILVPCPPVEEQGEIVRRVESLFALADAIEAKWQAIHGQVECLTPALLAKAFRGELVPQDPNDEPAAELLNCLAAQREATPARPRRQRAVI